MFFLFCVYVIDTGLSVPEGSRSSVIPSSVGDLKKYSSGERTWQICKEVNYYIVMAKIFSKATLLGAVSAYHHPKAPTVSM